MLLLLDKSRPQRPGTFSLEDGDLVMRLRLDNQIA